MDKSITAILIKTEELRDYDYRVTLFSAEGIERAVMRGVRKKDAKLKFACQPFAFCQYELSTKNNVIVTGASQIENLSSIVVDVDKFTMGCIMLESVENAVNAVDSSLLFVALLKSLKALLYSNADPRLVTMKFLQKILHESGFCRFETSDDNTATVSGLIGAVAGSFLDDLDGITADEETIVAGLYRIVTLFNEQMDCTLKSARGVLKLKKND